METRDSLARNVDVRTNLAIGVAFVGGAVVSVGSGVVHWSGVLFPFLLMGLPLAGRHLAARRGVPWLRTAVSVALFALVAAVGLLYHFETGGTVGMTMGSGAAL